MKTAGNPNVAPRCQDCGQPLYLSVGYTGADWDTVAGRDSGHGHEISLHCSQCNRVYPLLGVTDLREVSPHTHAFRDHSLMSYAELVAADSARGTEEHRSGAPCSSGVVRRGR